MYSVKLPLHDGAEVTLTGACPQKITATLPVYSLTTAEEASNITNHQEELTPCVLCQRSLVVKCTWWSVSNTYVTTQICCSNRHRDWQYTTYHLQVHLEVVELSEDHIWPSLKFIKAILHTNQLQHSSLPNKRHFAKMSIQMFHCSSTACPIYPRIMIFNSQKTPSTHCQRLIYQKPWGFSKKLKQHEVRSPTAAHSAGNARPANTTTTNSSASKKR